MAYPDKVRTTYILLCGLFLLVLSACNSSSSGSTVSVSISPSGPLTLTQGSQQQLSATVSGSSNIAVNWSSNNPAAATVSPAGLVQAVAAGSAVITATSLADSSKSASLTVVVQVASGGGPGSISGTVSIGAATASLSQAEFVPGELIVKFKPGLSLQSVATLLVGGVQLQQVRALSLADTYLYRTTQTRAATLSALSALQARSDVEYAQPNFILKAQATPNDPLYPQQWSLPAINLPAAWYVSGVFNPVTVAVLDTGIVSAHPDLQSKLLPGYDFVTGERGPNPEDTDSGDYHGSHVAGIIGAATNNNTGIAAVAWGAKILPLRVLSASGGSTSDIIDAIHWAAGLAVSGVANNPNPAAIINMSLGGPSRCTDSPALQQAINDALVAGAIITVAAGNGNPAGTPVDASTFTPASCSGVITVGATNRAGNRASYSNYGSRIDLMAPGGEASDGILSTIKNSSGNPDYGFLAGTSQAAPHVAGVLALMKSKKPSLGAAEALSILKNTAHLLSPTQCNRPSSSDCGAGLIDAGAALSALNTPPANTLVIGANPNTLTLTQGNNTPVSLTLSISNNFGGPVSLSVSGAPSGVQASLSSSSVSGNSPTATLNLSLSGNPAVGTYGLSVSGSGGGVNTSVSITLNIVAASSSSNLNGTLLTLFGLNGSDPNNIRCANEITISQNLVSAPFNFANLPAGNYKLQGWKDVNGNGITDAGDYFAWYTSSGSIAQLQPGSSGLQLVLQPYVGTNQATRVQGIFPPCQ